MQINGIDKFAQNAGKNLNAEKENKQEAELRFEVYKNIPTEKIAEYSNLIFENENQKKETLKSLEQGNIADVKFNFENQIFQGKATLNPQYKTLNLYDQNMVRVNTKRLLQLRKCCRKTTKM